MLSKGLKSNLELFLLLFLLILVKEAQADVDNIKTKIATSYENDIAHLSKSFDEKIELETKKSTKEVVSVVLEELMSKDNVAVTQDDLANIILKKVA
jgi:F-type H+-transporting ATPase subunit b